MRHLTTIASTKEFGWGVAEGVGIQPLDSLKVNPMGLQDVGGISIPKSSVRVRDRDPNIQERVDLSHSPKCVRINTHNPTSTLEMQP